MKKTMFFGSMAILLSLTSCNNEEDFSNQNEISQEHTINYEDGFELRRSFGFALAKALDKEPSVRSLIKTEALKMFDKDYDILYHLIKDKTLENGLTFRETLLKYYENPIELNELEQKLPLTTIFVPELPENSFSAESWNTETEIPLVALRSSATNDVPILDANGDEFILEAAHIPGFPVVVIKNCERVYVNTNNVKSTSTNTLRSQNRDFEFSFLDDIFDNSIIEEKKNNLKSTTYLSDPKISTAYNMYKNSDGWQRDYIYYNISPGTPRGQFHYDYQEHITSFKLIGDKAAYEKIADQTGDPTIRQGANISGWTGGYFEFKVKALINATNGVGTEYFNYIIAQPSELFDVAYDTKKVSNITIYTIKSIKCLTKEVSCSLINWDLNQYASSIKIEIEEVDNTETLKTTDSRNVKYATNFEISNSGIGKGLLEKVGLKFGSSKEKTEIATVERTYTIGNDELGSVIVNFSDQTVLSAYPGGMSDLYFQCDYRKYNTGWYEITVRPIKVQ